MWEVKTVIMVLSTPTGVMNLSESQDYHSANKERLATMSHERLVIRKLQADLADLFVITPLTLAELFHL